MNVPELSSFALIMFFKIVSFLSLLHLSTMMADSSASGHDEITRALWDGVAFFVPVSRQLVQKRLNEWHQANSDDCNQGEY